MAKKNNDLRSEFLKTMTQFITAAFAFVAALAWNDTIKSIIDRFVAPGSGLRSKIYYSVIVTILAVFVTYYLGKLNQEAKEEEVEADQNNKDK